ncbi:hypothetical protein EVAR_71073_1 [Eumeta japonica]|uniref:Uncharacterized protein n=1 Tax=Eumeta variegata TaxID=151549 RepID=A0A4C1SR43_EUMVA|nr:hypothetical protein EVAR_71073_1 [Eumeta japonica]
MAYYTHIETPYIWPELEESESKSPLSIYDFRDLRNVSPTAFYIEGNQKLSDNFAPDGRCSDRLISMNTQTYVFVVLRNFVWRPTSREDEAKQASLWKAWDLEWN